VAKAKKTAAKKMKAARGRAVAKNVEEIVSERPARRGPSTDGLDAKTRLDAAIAAIDMAEDGGMVAVPIAAAWRLALTVTCSSCSADVGELCVVHGKGSKSKIAKQPCSIRVEHAKSAAQFIDTELAKQGKQRKGATFASGASTWMPDAAAVAAGTRQLPTNIEVELKWGSETKRGLLVRWNGAGNPVVRVRRVDAKGEYLDEFGSDRVMTPDDIIGPWTGAATTPIAKMEDAMSKVPMPDAAPAKKPRASRTPAKTPDVAASSSDTKPETPAAKSGKKPRDYKVTGEDKARSGACTIAACPARFEGTAMPPDWKIVGGFRYCPPHAVAGQRIADNMSREAPTTPANDTGAPMASKVVKVDPPPAAARMCAHHDAPGVRCAKLFYGSYRPQGWSELDTRALGVHDGDVEFYCPQHLSTFKGRVNALTNGGVNNEPEPDAITRGRREMGMAEEDIVSLERTTAGGNVAPSKYDNAGACGDANCRARFYSRMPQTWEWWKGHFWCPKHIPAEVKAILAEKAKEFINCQAPTHLQPERNCLTHGEPMICPHACAKGTCRKGCEEKTDHELRAPVATSTSDADEAPPWDEPSGDVAVQLAEEQLDEPAPWDEPGIEAEEAPPWE
jgi:hypothetical protein